MSIETPRYAVRTIALALFAVLTAGQALAADQVIFLVRHAERAATPPGQPTRNMMGEDPPLNEAGQQRALKLAALLASAEIKHIFTTEYQRTRQTAAPAAERYNVKPVMSAARDPDPLVEQMTKAAGNVLVIGHSNTVPDLLKRLGVKQAIAIPDSEYDNLFVVVRHGTGEPTLIRLRY
jgi:phosphohistidine phosphatase SixA